MFGTGSRYITETPDGIKKLRKAINDAETIVIGAGAGLSTSAGFTYTGERLEKYFGDFVARYNIPDMYSGGFMVMQLPPEVLWAYWSRYIYINRYMDPPKPVYDMIYDLVDGRAKSEGGRTKDEDLPAKDYFVLTTNVDHCFQKAGFDKQRLFYTQGDYGLWQCSVPCHNKTYDNYEAVKDMLISQGFTIEGAGGLSIPDARDLKMEIPSELVPVCPVCGGPMTMNLRADDTFVQDEGWDHAADRYSNFIRTHRHSRTLFLDIGTGMNTPGIVKCNFWRLTNEWDDAVYACINLGEAYAPKEIEDKSICVDGDIGEVLRDLQ